MLIHLSLILLGVAAEVCDVYKVAYQLLSTDAKSRHQPDRIYTSRITGLVDDPTSCLVDQDHENSVTTPEQLLTRLKAVLGSQTSALVFDDQSWAAIVEKAASTIESRDAITFNYLLASDTFWSIDNGRASGNG